MSGWYDSPEHSPSPPTKRRGRSVDQRGTPPPRRAPLPPHSGPTTDMTLGGHSKIAPRQTSLEPPPPFVPPLDWPDWLSDFHDPDPFLAICGPDEVEWEPQHGEKPSPPAQLQHPSAPSPPPPPQQPLTSPAPPLERKRNAEWLGVPDPEPARKRPRLTIPDLFNALNDPDRVDFPPMSHAQLPAPRPAPGPILAPPTVVTLAAAERVICRPWQRAQAQALVASIEDRGLVLSSAHVFHAVAARRGLQFDALPPGAVRPWRLIELEAIKGALDLLARFFGDHKLFGKQIAGALGASEIGRGPQRFERARQHLGVHDRDAHVDGPASPDELRGEIATYIARLSEPATRILAESYEATTGRPWSDLGTGLAMYLESGAARSALELGFFRDLDRGGTTGWGSALAKAFCVGGKSVQTLAAPSDERRTRGRGHVGAEVIEYTEPGTMKRAEDLIRAINTTFGVGLDSLKSMRLARVQTTVAGGRPFATSAKRDVWTLPEIEGVHRALQHFAAVLGSERRTSALYATDQEVESVGRIAYTKPHHSIAAKGARFDRRSATISIGAVPDAVTSEPMERMVTALLARVVFGAELHTFSTRVLAPHPFGPEPSPSGAFPGSEADLVHSLTRYFIDPKGFKVSHPRRYANVNDIVDDIFEPVRTTTLPTMSPGRNP